MRKVILVLALAMLAQGMAAGQDKTGVLAAVHQFVDAFNKGDTQAAAAVCAGQSFIIDEFPPYQWHGAGACMKWMSDYDADAKKNGITDGKVTLASPRHVEISGGHAYVVVPADYSFKLRGKAAGEKGSMLTVALLKATAGWRIVAWTWSKN